MELGEASSASGLCMQNLQRVRYGRLAALWAGEIRAFVVCVCCVHMYAPCFTYINLQDLEGYDIFLFLFLPPLSSVSLTSAKVIGYKIVKRKGKIANPLIEAGHARMVPVRGPWRTRPRNAIGVARKGTSSGIAPKEVRY